MNVRNALNTLRSSQITPAVKKDLAPKQSRKKGWFRFISFAKIYIDMFINYLSINSSLFQKSSLVSSLIYLEKTLIWNCLFLQFILYNYSWFSCKIHYSISLKYLICLSNYNIKLTFLENSFSWLRWFSLLKKYITSYLTNYCSHSL